MRGTKYTRESLGPIVASSRSLAEVMRELGLRPTGGNHRFIRARVRGAGLDTSHFGRGDVDRIAELSRDTLEPLVRSSRSLAQVMTKLGLPAAGRAHGALAKRLVDLGVDQRHMSGRAWARGQTTDTDPGIRRSAANNTRTNAEVFVEDSRETNGRRLAKRLRGLGWPYQCAVGTISERRGAELVLHLDHINGVNSDNRLENLRFLCPNCHSQTDTYSNRRRSKAR